MQLLSTVWLANGPKISTLPGAEKGFVSRPRTRYHGGCAGNPVNPCQTCLLGSPRVGTTRASAYRSAAASSIFGSFLSAVRGLRARRFQGTLLHWHRWRHVGATHQTYLESSRADQPPQKCVIWTRWRPVPVKNAIIVGPSSRRRSRELILPQRQSITKMTSTKKGTLRSHARDVNILIWTRASQSIMEQMIAS